MRNVVVLGATGHFGGRICRRLTDEDNVKLFVSGRSIESSRELAGELRSRATRVSIQATALDHRAPDFPSRLGALDPYLVIHTAGPYQGQDYTVAKACLENGSHYIDLADGRKFVEEFTVLDEAAKSRDLLLITGASTLPGLSSAVLSAFRNEFSSIESIEITIAPAHRTPRGPSTISAVMSYCGRPFSVLEGGAWRTRYGWQNLKRVKYPDLGRRLAGACDVPDLSLLPKAHPSVRTVTFHAALEAPWEQLSLWIMGSMARLGLVKDWSRYASVFESMSKRLIKLGSDRGGMSIRMTGIDHGGRDRRITWYLTAERNHGPEIPCTPALLLARKLLRSQLAIRGAMPCLALFSLDDFAEELREYDVSWRHQRE